MALSLAPPPARLYPNQTPSWQVETCDDDHAQFLAQILMGQVLDGDRELPFEHRLSKFGDNFKGHVERVVLEAGQGSLVWCMAEERQQAGWEKDGHEETVRAAVEAAGRQNFGQVGW